MLRVENYCNRIGSRLVTDVVIPAGNVIYKIDRYTVLPQATFQTIQISETDHILELDVTARLNHSCQPNCIINTSSMTLSAIRDIAVGKELSFFYPSTEWDMSRPFVCFCGSPQCVRWVAGARYLSADTLSRYFINRHICHLIAEMTMHASPVDLSPAERF